MSRNWTTREFAEALRNQGIANHIEAACGQPARRSKFNVDHSESGKLARTCDAILFASEAEMNAYKVVKILEGKGIITELRLQPRYELQPRFTDAQGGKHRAGFYVGDFEFLRDGQRVCVDVKGHETPVFKWKAKAFRMKYPTILLEIWR